MAMAIIYRKRRATALYLDVDQEWRGQGGRGTMHLSERKKVPFLSYPAHRSPPIHPIMHARFRLLHTVAQFAGSSTS